MRYPQDHNRAQRPKTTPIPTTSCVRQVFRCSSSSTQDRNIRDYGLLVSYMYIFEAVGGAVGVGELYFWPSLLYNSYYKCTRCIEQQTETMMHACTHAYTQCKWNLKSSFRKHRFAYASKGMYACVLYFDKYCIYVPIPAKMKLLPLQNWRNALSFSFEPKPTL